MKRRMKVQLTILVALLCLVAGWSHRLMARGRRLAVSAAQDTIECERLAATIERMAVRPQVAIDRERRRQETTGVIEGSARSAGIPDDRLIRIAPQAPQRVGDSVYKAKPTQVLLKNITLKQLVGFSHGLLTSGQGLGVKSIRLRAARPNDPADRWDAEIVATYLIYDPKQQGS